MKCIGIFGGSFNPVHCGHIALAAWMLEHGYVNEIWLMLSPQNPLKCINPGATDEQRREMLTLACDGIEGLHPCFVEFDMPRPSYTIDTLKRLSTEFPEYNFKLIIGSDNWNVFNKWRSPEQIIEDYGVIVYPRPLYPISNVEVNGVTYAADAPTWNVSSTAIRDDIHGNLSMLPQKVANYIKENSLYGYNQ